MEFLIIPNKDEAKLINWLRKAVSKDDARPVMETIHVVKNGRSAACDGYRLHLVSTPDCLKEQAFADAMITPVNKAATRPDVPNEFTTSDFSAGTYPDIDQIMPKGEPTFTIGVNPKLLIEALQGFEEGQPAILKFYRPTTPFTVTEADSDKLALIMPMHIED